MFPLLDYMVVAVLAKWLDPFALALPTRPYCKGRMPSWAVSVAAVATYLRRFLAAPSAVEDQDQCC